jgi:hypothetical protein
MTVHRIHYTANFTVLPNALLQDDCLTWAARGLLAYLFSRGDGWEVQTAHLVTQSPMGRDGVRSVLRELELIGYLFRWQERLPNGTFNYRSEIFASKVDCTAWKEEHGVAKPLPGADPTSDGQSGVGQRGPLINTNSANTDQENTEFNFKEAPATEFPHHLEPIDAEIVEENNLSQNQPDFVDSSIVEIKSSGAAAIFSGTIGGFLGAYSQDKPPLWADVSKSTPSRERAFKALIKVYGDQNAALQAFREALAFCRQDSWWASKSLSLDNVLTNGKVVELAEKWQVIASNPQKRQALSILADPEKLRMEQARLQSRKNVAEVRARLEREAANA